MRGRQLAALVGVLVLVAALGLVRSCGDDPAPGGVATVPIPASAEGDAATEVPDPFAWDPDRRDELVRRAGEGFAHGLYRFSPGGIEASAARTARWRELVEKTAKEADVDPNRLEGLVLLESAGREDALTSAGIEGAAGVVQIVAGTATSLLNMDVDVAESKRLTRRIDRELRRGRLLKVEELRERRRKVDPRFDPPQAFAGAARYLIFARERLGREDLAFVSYHMGVGNLQGVLSAFGEDEPDWAQVYFDSAPTSHPESYAKLRGFADDSANYLWKIEAAMEVMRLFRENPGELRRRAVLQTNKASSEELLHPQDATARFADPAALRRAWDAEEIIAFPDDAAVTGLRRDPRMGELARRVDAPAGLYRGLRPEALAMALYIGAQVRAIAGETTSLNVTSTVRDDAYQAQLVRRNREATRNYSLHTTGWAFDVQRDYSSRAHAQAFQFVLERLQALNLIAWVREPGAIHITVASDAKALLGLLERIGIDP